MNNKKLRKKFDNIKRRKGYYLQFNGKKKGYELHHPLGLSALEYVVYLFKYVHDLVHSLKDSGQIDEPEWSSIAPTISEMWEDVSIAATKKAIQRANEEMVARELKNRGK